jgi:hypothetical protein
MNVIGKIVIEVHIAQISHVITQYEERYHQACDRPVEDYSDKSKSGISIFQHKVIIVADIEDIIPGDYGVLVLLKL